MTQEEPLLLPLRPVLTNTPLIVRLELIYATTDKAQILKLLKVAYMNPEKITGRLVIKDKLLLNAKIKELENGARPRP